MTQYTVALLGGDERMLYAGRQLAASGFSVRTFGVVLNGERAFSLALGAKEAVAQADFVLLPVPMSRDGRTVWMPTSSSEVFLRDVFAWAPSHARILGGGSFDDPRFFDYSSRADFAQANAVPTAEGALLLALQNLPCTINAMSVGVIGFGRVGKAVAALFRAAGAHVTVFARRREVCTVASMLGYGAAPISELCHRAKELRCLINTVPSPVVGEETFCVIRPDAIVLELASAPYGMNFETARTFGVRVILASGLPGKYSAETAGRVIASTVLTMLCEWSIPF